MPEMCVPCWQASATCLWCRNWTENRQKSPQSHPGPEAGPFLLPFLRVSWKVLSLPGFVTPERTLQLPSDLQAPTAPALLNTQCTQCLLLQTPPTPPPRCLTLQQEAWTSLLPQPLPSVKSFTYPVASMTFIFLNFSKPSLFFTE